MLPSHLRVAFSFLEVAMSIYEFAIAFAGEHWFLAWCLLWLLWAPYLTLCLAVKLAARTCRLLMVALRGWPPQHLDADGDWKPQPQEAD